MGGKFFCGAGEGAGGMHGLGGKSEVHRDAEVAHEHRSRSRKDEPEYRLATGFAGGREVMWGVVMNTRGVVLIPKILQRVGGGARENFEEKIILKNP